MAPKRKRTTDTTTPKIILIDMDDTIAGFTAHALALMKERHPHVALPSPDETTFPLAHSLAKAHAPLLKALYVEPGFFRDMPPIDGSIKALHSMVAHGYNVRLCTSPLASSPICLAEKAEWVIRHLGPQWIDRLILTRDKTLVRGELLIDDAPQAKGDSATPSWRHVYFAQPHNAPGKPGASAARPRLERWSEWQAFLEREVGPPA